VWFEVMLMASFVLLALGGERAQLEGAIKYVTLNLVASTLFLTAAGLLYALTGTLNMADLAVKLQGAPHTGLVSTLAMLFLVSFGIKAGVFPLFFWLPASYHTPPFAVSALFAGLLTKVGVYTLIRVFTLIFVGDVGYTHSIILAIAGLTMLSGVLGALAQGEVRRVLSFLLISGIGFAVMGLGLFTQAGLAASVVYLIHTIIVTTALFLLAGVVHHLGGSESLAKLGGLYASRPGVALLFAICALSLAGIPPFSGFIGKLALLRAALGSEQYGITAAALVASVLTLLAVARIWAQAFWKDASEHQPRVGRAPAAMVLPIAVLTTLSVLAGLGAAPVLTLSERAAQQLLDPSQYVRAVLGDGRGKEGRHHEPVSVEHPAGSGVGSALGRVFAAQLDAGVRFGICDFAVRGACPGQLQVLPEGVARCGVRGVLRARAGARQYARSLRSDDAALQHEAGHRGHPAGCAHGRRDHHPG
jgi:multicomponent Na+:H+ antiporter subunit D